MRLAKFVIVAVAIWSAFWAIGAFGLRTAFSEWFAARAAEGWQADYAQLVTAGYPFTHKIDFQNPALADPGTGAAWRADSIGFESPALWPGRQVVHFAQTPQLLSYFDAKQTLTADAMRADLRIAPSLTLPLKTLSLTAQDWDLSQDGDLTMKGAGLVLAMTRLEGPTDYQFDVAVPDFTPGRRLRRIMGGAENLPDSFDALQLDAQVVFDRPWDRRALEERRPQPVAIDLHLAEAAWGPLQLSFSGQLDILDGGVPEGQIAVRAEQWREMLRMGQNAGAIPASLVQAAEQGLGFLAGLSGRPDSLDVRLNFTGGVVALGPVPLGPAPRFVFR